MKKNFLAIIILIIIHLQGISQTEKQLVPSDLKQLTIVTEPSTLYKGFFRAGTAISYGVVDKYFNNDHHKVYFLNSAWASNAGFNFIFQYGITDRLQIDVAIPFALNVRQSESHIYVPSADTSINYSFTLKGRGLADCYFTVKYQLINEKTTNTSLTGSLELMTPTGRKNPTDFKGETDYKPPVGTGCFSTTAGLSFRKINYPFSYSTYFYYIYQFPGSKLIDPSDKKETSFKDGNHIEAGLNVGILLNEWIALTNEVNLYYRSKDKVDNKIPADAIAAWAVSYEPRFVFQIKRFRIAEAVRIPLLGKGVSADPLYVLIAQYVF
jgi:hypothetical protein